MERVDELIEGIVVERLSRPDARDLLLVEKRTDINELRDKAAALRTRQERSRRTVRPRIHHRVAT